MADDDRGGCGAAVQTTQRAGLVCMVWQAFRLEWLTITFNTAYSFRRDVVFTCVRPRRPSSGVLQLDEQPAMKLGATSEHEALT